MSSETASPDIAAYAVAVVLISGAMGPSVSSDLLSGITPAMSMLPNAGLNPATPQSDPGMRIEPPVSLPIAQSHIPAATATAEPPEEPPATRDGSRGLRTVPKCGLTLVTPYANSCRLVLPTILQPARRIRATTGASSAAGSRGRIIPPAVVTMPLTSIRSLTATTVPLPESAVIEMKAFSSGLSRIRARAASRSIRSLSGVERAGRGVILPG